jgi:hypothetical protein
MTTTQDRDAAVREQSAALAAMLGQAPGSREPVNGRPPTANERAFLAALAAPGATMADGRWRARDLIAASPALAGKHTNGLHITAHSLMRKGLVRRRKAQDRVSYQLTDAGRAAIT